MFKEILSGAVTKSLWLTASSYMGKYLRISSYIRKPNYSYTTLQLLHSEFPYILYEENLIFFFISAVSRKMQGRFEVSQTRAAPWRIFYQINFASKQKEMILYKPSSEEWGDQRYFFHQIQTKTFVNGIERVRFASKINFFLSNVLSSLRNNFLTIERVRFASISKKYQNRCFHFASFDIYTIMWPPKIFFQYIKHILKYLSI
jgi:hypothetical protein